MAIYTNNNEFTPQISTGEKIKKYRLNNNLSQVDVARMMKKSPVWLSKIETDQREIKVNDLVKICKIFHIDISELLGINKNNSGYKGDIFYEGELLQKINTSIYNKDIKYSSNFSQNGVRYITIFQ